MMSDKSDQRALAIESLQRRTERGLTELGQAIGGYRGVAEAMDAQLLRQDTRIEQLEAVNADLLAALEFMISNCPECDGDGVIYDDDYWTVGPTGGPCPICQGPRAAIAKAEATQP